MSKIIFLDIDGTLLPKRSNTISDLVKEAIIKVRENGHKVILCTGRTRFAIECLLDTPFDGWIVSAGGYIEAEGNLISKTHCNQQSVELAIEIMNRYRIHYRLESDHRCFQSDEMLTRFYGVEDIEKYREQNNLFYLEDYNKEPIQTIYFFGESKDEIIELQERTKGKFQFMLYNEDEDGIVECELINLAVNKAKGMEEIIQYYHAKQEDTIAFGDSMNDLEMIQYASYGVAMGNASDIVKQNADSICESCYEDGVYFELKRQGLFE